MSYPGQSGRVASVGDFRSTPDSGTCRCAALTDAMGHQRTFRPRSSSSNPLAPATKCVDWRRTSQERALAIERPNRRLTTILAADAVGDSRLVGIDEEGTLD